ncbi:hypothetical protein [Streptomyces sp. NPDC051677]|uniref:hypothetical protein n=1 Tax=Streptomyces sp. NPDC051677 TaxID=3365669 RepID=UPI0037D01DC5
MTNPELAAALGHVPEIERTEKLLADAKKRLRDHPAGVDPDAARNDVIDGAVLAFQTDGTWRANIGRDAAKAHAEASAWQAERMARSRAVDSTARLAYDTRQDYSADALAYLGTRLEEVLSDARTAAETLGDVRSADDAIKAGGDVVAAWGRLQGLVVDLVNIRAGQWELLLPRLRPGDAVGGFDEERRKVRAWRSDGYGETRGRLDDVPAFALDAMRRQQYTEAYLLWLARVGTAYVPTSVENLEADVMAATEPVMHDDHGPLVDYSPYVTPLPAPVPSQVYAHSSAAHLDHSQPAPARPKANATVADPAPATYIY